MNFFSACFFNFFNNVFKHRGLFCMDLLPHYSSLGLSLLEKAFYIGGGDGDDW